MRKIGRVLLLGVALCLLAVGGLAFGIALAPEHGLVQLGRDLVLNAATALAADPSRGLPPELPLQVQGWLDGVLLRFAATGAGLVLLVVALLPGRRTLPQEPEAFDAPPDKRTAQKADGRTLKKAKRDASALAKSGAVSEAGDACFHAGLLDDAVRYYVQAEEFERAAEVRHDQNRFMESAELYLKAGRADAAGGIYSQQGEYLRAGETYLDAGNQSIAAEMFEKGEDYRRAADCFAEAGFPRHAAQCYVKCEEWKKAAVCLEDVIVEEGAAGGGGDPRKRAELEKLVRMAGNLYVRAGMDERAQAVLEKGGCYGPAAEIALRRKDLAHAAELFLEAKDPPRAAAVMRSLGDEVGAARVMAEYHRDKGEDDQAAACYEQAGEFVAAGDLYRLMELYDRAGECYERHGDPSQAGEMFRMAGDRVRAAANYERAGLYAQSAECHALAGDTAREAEMLVLAGEALRAGELHHREGRDDDAITALQQVEADHPGFTAASALLGEIFRERGMLNLAVKKLEQATADQEIQRENVRAFYMLATVYEASSQNQSAVELYEKILAFDYHHEDVSQRLERARAQLEQEQARERATAESQGALSSSSGAGRYKIVGKLGRGGMGIVYKAEDTVLERTVAYKVLPEALKENPQALKNFLREAKSAAQLNHPNIVTVYDAGEQDGVYYIAMEYVDGSTLKEIVKHRGPISPSGIVHVLSQMCEGLAFAHDKKIVHRDVKTANTMWTRDRKAKIMDFGLAKVVEEVRNHTTVVSGTPYYMSPEQTLGKNVDHRTDIYSLGVTVFEMATGTLPFREGNLPYHHVHTPPPDPREFKEDLPPLLAQIILRCLEKDPDARFGNAREILAALRQSSAG